MHDADHAEIIDDLIGLDASISLISRYNAHTARTVTVTAILGGM